MTERWWQSAAFYHLYLPSFADGNGDGFGDLPGVREHVDHLAWLGVDAVWLSPFCRSRMEDFGYDVTDYCDVDPAFGTLADLRGLVDDLHRRGIRVVMDLVVNHTSRFHPWFLDAVARTDHHAFDSSHRDYYVWREPAADGGPPNNWRSINAPDVPGSAWVWYAEHERYLLCSFAPTQPDLNWSNPAVVEEMRRVVRFWLDQGLDGFRLDMVEFIGKDPRFPDQPPVPVGQDYFSHATVQLSLAEMLAQVARLREVTDRYDDRVLIGEVGAMLSPDRLIALHADGRGLDLPHNFGLGFVPWEAGPLQAAVDAYDAAMTGTAGPNWVLSSHDLPRMTAHGAAPARLALMMLLTLRGSPFLYYGEELGMANAAVPVERRRDPWRSPETGLGRDPSRTPMQWSSDAWAGFGTVEPWLPVTEDHTVINVADQRRDPDSTLVLTRTLLLARRDRPALASGRYARYGPVPDSVMAYTRTSHDQQALILLNFGPDPVTARDLDHDWTPGIGTHPGRATGATRSVALAGYEGVVLWR